MRYSGFPCRSVTIAVIAAGLASSVAAQSPTPTSAITVHIETTDHSVRRRAEFAAREAWVDYSNWLGPREPQTVTIAGLAWRSAPPAMDVESLVSYEVARLWWRDRFGESVTMNGVAWYLQSRVVERLYDLTFHRPGHSSEAVRFFGGAIPYSLPAVRLSRWNAGLARAEWLRAGERWPMPGRQLPPSVDAPAIGVAMAMASFEHAAGWPTLQAALFGAAQAPRSGRQLADVLNDAAGMPILTPAAAAGDVAIAAASDIACPNSPCRITRVTVARDETVLGVVVPIRIDFADGQSVETRLGANERMREFVFESTAPYAGVRLDPDRTVLSDVNLLNNIRLASPASNVPTTKWLARWVIWLEDAMLLYSALF
jgi:hypothetical protein